MSEFYLIYPCDMSKAVLYSSFQDHLNRPKYTGNPGVDLSSYGQAKLPIWLSADGVISKVGFDPDGYGNYVKADHGNGYETLYAHLDSVSVRVGDRLEVGDLIGIMGETGNTTGVHVHWELRVDGECVDAMLYVDENYIVYPEPEPGVPVESVVEGDWVRVIADWGLNLRTVPDASQTETVITTMPDGTEFEVEEVVVDADGNRWARVRLYAAMEYRGERLVEVVE